MATEIVVTPLEPTRFGVSVTEGEVTTTHKVAVHPDLLDDLGLSGIDPVDIVRETFEYLLDREPASAIQGDFPLEQIAEHHPDFYDELAARLGG